ncbi:hypothetical protein [Pseudomonas sp.]|uniref:hypothetical protein n=1 Tax=Pseudomonas sp. TaxID=306 RepID=UPI002608A823|nr:hypothetical protein [Pseudomonas sp.]
MAIIVNTANPKSLLSEIKQAIADSKIVTWSCDGQGDFSHTAEQWKYHAWFRAKIEESRLVFNTVPPKGKVISRVDYGVYHGRFIEMLLSHFDERFRDASATAMPSSGDVIRSRTAPE